jgi:hypothetical protein
VLRLIAILSLSCLALSGCSPGGEYVQSDRQAGDVDRGETNGRMFDFVSNKPEDDDWQIRVRDDSMWVGYGNEGTSEGLGNRSLSKRDAERLWKKIDDLEIGERKKGKKDLDFGYIQLRLREPGGDERHELITIYVSRETKDDDVIALAEYLRDLVGKYYKEKPNF